MTRPAVISVALILVAAITSWAGLTPAPPEVPGGNLSSPASDAAIQVAAPTAHVARFAYWPLKRGRIIAADQQALWFDADGAIWRYYVQTRTMETFDILKGLPPTSPDSVVLGPEGAFIMSYGLAGSSRAYVWRAAKDWTLLGGVGWGGLCFDAEGRLLRSANNPVPTEGFADREAKTSDLLRLNGDHWEAAGQVPLHQRLYAVGQGYFFSDYSIVRNRARYRFGYISAGLGDWKPCDNPQSVWIEQNSHYLVGGKVYVICRPPDYVRKRYLAEIGESGLTIFGEVSGSGLDLRLGAICVLLKRREAHQAVYTLVLSDGNAPSDLPVPASVHAEGALPLIFRDANGDVWLDDWRWDGKRWEQMRPGGAPAAGEGWRVMESGLFVLESQPGPEGRRLFWRKTCLQAPDNAVCFNAADRTGWVEKCDSLRPHLEYWRWPEHSAPEMIRSFQEIYITSSAVQRAPDGDYWWIGRPDLEGDERVWRLTAKGELWDYPCLKGAGRSDGGRSRPRILYVSPSGRVWMWSVSSGFERFDPEVGGFVNDEPWDEFAFNFGKWRLSVLPITGARYSEDYSGPVGTVMVQRAGKWLPLICPFGSGPLSVGRTSAFLGDRMIATLSGGGIVEYDATRDQWCLLVSGYSGPAGFGPRGERVMGYQSTGILALDSDPFTLIEGVQDIQAERDLFYPLYDRIRGRDADDAEAAMKEMEQLPPDSRKRLWSVLDRACLDLEKEKSSFYQRVLKLEMSVRPPHTTERAAAFRAVHPWMMPTRLPIVEDKTP